MWACHRLLTDRKVEPSGRARLLGPVTCLYFPAWFLFPACWLVPGLRRLHWSILKTVLVPHPHLCCSPGLLYVCPFFVLIFVFVEETQTFGNADL